MPANVDSVMIMAENILGKEEGREWMSRRNPSLGNEIPMTLLDTEKGRQLVAQATCYYKWAGEGAVRAAITYLRASINACLIYGAFT
jgi:hypothetical protein